MSRSMARQRIAIIGAGISGMSAAWLLDQHHEVTVFERAGRVGGHSNTVHAQTPTGITPVDTGFIVFNEEAYPNLVALFKHLNVPTAVSDMSFAVSLNNGALEYSGSDLRGLFAQKRNIVSPRFWSMLRDLVSFYRGATRDAASLDPSTSLGDYLRAGGFGAAFRDDHLLPMAGAIWSAPADSLLEYPAASFIRFYENHGLLKLRDRPAWCTVVGGSEVYVERLTRPYADRIRTGDGVAGIRRDGGTVAVRTIGGHTSQFDHVVMATHADEAVALLDDPTPQERALLGAFRYTRNLAVLHSDVTLMPKRRAAWSSWNYMGLADGGGRDKLCVSYWMNRLQPLRCEAPVFLTLNPPRPPRAGTLLHTETYEHPLFDGAAMASQRALWSFQGKRNTWFCGAYFGAGFHEDGLQAGLAVAEQLGAVRRPWTVANESGRIALGNASPVARASALAA